VHRRIVLLVGVLAALALLAGCSAPGGLDMDPADDAAVADEASTALEDLPPVHLESGRPPRELVRTAVQNGSTDVTAFTDPLEVDLPFQVDGAYYNLTETVVDTQTTNAVTIEVEYDSTTTNGSAIDYADLPAVDRAALDALFPQRVPPREEGPDFGVGATYSDADLEASVLAPTQEYDAVVVDGQRHALTVSDPRETTVRTYRYAATEVAPDDSAFAAQLRDRYAFTLSDLSDAERDVVTSAIDGGYSADSSDDAFEALVERFRSRAAVVDDGSSGTWLVRYEGTLYLADLRYGGFVDE